jgi:putative methyltransferase (TIGR04325 family)
MIRSIAKVVLKTRFAEGIFNMLEGKAATRQLLQKASGLKGVYPNFDAAWKAAKSYTQSGHDKSAAPIGKYFSTGLRPGDYPVLFWLQRLSAGGLKVFDYGGSVGNVYHSYQPYLSSTDPIDWLVYDLPEVVDAGEEWVREKSLTGLHFTKSICPTTSDRILLISGALHYWEGDMRALMEQFSTPPDHILINRSPFHSTEPTFCIVQVVGERKTGGDYAVPCMVRNSSELISQFAELGYDLVDQWKTPERYIFLPLFPRKSVDSYSGFYLKRRR